MAIYIRTRPTTKTKVLGYLCALATIGAINLYILAAFPLGSALTSLETAIANNDRDLELQSLFVLIGIPTVFGAALTGFYFGMNSCLKGTDRRLPQDTTAIHRDITSAQFLHIAQSPSRRATGRLQWTLASILLATSPVDVPLIPLLLIPNNSTPELEKSTFLGVAALVMVLIVALTLAWAGTRRRMSSVCMTPQGMAVVKPFPSGLPLPSSRGNLSIQEVPAHWGRMTVRAVYTPPAGNTEQRWPVIIPRLGLTVKPSRLDDARSRVDARLDEVWRAAQLIRASIEQEETADAPPSEAEPKLAYQPPHQDAAPATTSPRQRPLSHE
ncbi:hypothetical protein BKH27_05715 [Actinomyces oris]|uniref:Uncharacterized protein n=1 Tax=Actinomyces oris TaxID=544580 RepID=A0A1Q8VYJ6_9ACTO|nr:hypothetical protein [Actinomyces oris]OLO53520.1 hypothetical protein BKH27_05715 [Actinomyces oris]